MNNNFDFLIPPSVQDKCLRDMENLRMSGWGRLNLMAFMHERLNEEAVRLQKEPDDYDRLQIEAFVGGVIRCMEHQGQLPPTP